MNVLWLSPNLNHYKAGFLNKLVLNTNIELTVLSGSGRKGKGDNYSFSKKSFQLINLEVSKSKFGFSEKVRAELKKNFTDYDWILIPREKKNFILFLYAMLLKKKAYRKGCNPRLISYNHPMITSNGGEISSIDRLFTRFYYHFYDRIIFYTQKSCLDMVRQGFIKKEKAFWANNTIDTQEIESNYLFSYPDPNQPTILYIGRLIPSKKLEILLEYYQTLKKQFSKNNKTLKLIIIGDGSSRNIIEDAKRIDNSIEWTGSLINESKIAPYMKRASMIFVPGHSGLSINHAFCYGRPYFTIKSKTHAPEIHYLKDEVNGFLLENNKMNNIKLIYSFLDKINKTTYDNANKEGKYLSIENWCKQISNAFETKI